MLGGIDRQNEVVRARNLPYKVRLPTREILTTLAFWLRSSVVSVLNSLTTITEAPPLVFGYLIFAALVLRALLATRGRDDLATAVSACVVGGIPFSSTFCLRLSGTLFSRMLGMLQNIALHFAMLYNMSK